MKQTTEDNFAEIYNTMTSDMMAENPEIAISNLGPGRKIASQFKGLSKEEQEQIRLEQLAQIEEKRVSLIFLDFFQYFFLLPVNRVRL